MKTKNTQLFLVMLLGFFGANAQISDRKAEKEKKKVEREKEIAALVESKSFVFKGDRAIPSGYKSMDLTTNPNFVDFLLI
jgi:hypothetical protein